MYEEIAKARTMAQALDYVAEAMDRDARQELVDSSLMETRAQGLEPSNRSKMLAQQWVNGEIPFVIFAQGVAEEAEKEEREKERRSHEE